MRFDLAQLCDALRIPRPEPGDARSSVQILGVNTLALAEETDLCFAEHDDQTEAVLASRAGAVLVPEDFPAIAGPLLLRSPTPRQAFFQIAERFVPASEIQGIHPSAVIDPSAVLGRDVAIGACAVIASGVRIGDRGVIGPGVYLGPDVTLGADCLIESNVSVHRDSRIGERCIIHSGTVIGGDGFGFVWDGGGHRKIPQLGRVVIEEDVEIGCNACVDRATLGETRIRRGTKIDNLVQVAHNTDIGAHVILVSQSGVAGSSKVGSGAVVAGQVAISDHVEVGAGARIGGQSGVTKDVPAGASVFGTPARPIKDTLRELAALAQLPALLKLVRTQGRELERLRERLEALERERPN
ncbi:UDP-3-O-(3-hydroxymyristoyl)glucosamine N-acyltransferase [Thiocystis violacea]|uniref:UDP-3-O-(3-hydroxymyristoyl)glucosamine N-acyltransferase n=1 Tax=Thiocystis violacea TaxID=13725 RepID=UPI001905E915|nr:UDP-3-O-(3-hydroxymyristoyl)glucosamine N-acyltransferase [Thiocystis violacea]MBK1720133.1 UDP-3-O-(3-hydroxymyristoyl)glucosamine N-acyltransferase [Thiocystis violacea]